MKCFVFALLALSACGGSVGKGSTGGSGGGGAGDAGFTQATEAGVVQMGRMVASCGDCRSGEFCVADFFQGDECEELPPSGTCPPGTSSDGDCCAPDGTTTYFCWPNLPACGAKVSCACAAGVVSLQCGGSEEDDNCAETDTGLYCEELSG